MEIEATQESADLVIDCSILVVGGGEVLRDASVAITDGVIVGVGSRGEIHASFTAERVVQRPRHLLMPGLVNAHTHLAMTLLRGYAEGVDLAGFLERVFAAEARVMADPVGIAIGTELAAAESLLAGATSTLDMYFSPATAHEAAVRIGLRHVTGPIFLDRSDTDRLTWSDRMAAAEAWPNELARIGGPWIPPFVQPHGTYTVSPEHLRDVASVASRIDARVHVHASENLGENQIVAERYNGATPVQLLRDAGVLERPVVIGHGVYLTDEDIDLLAAADAGVAHCPVSNLKLASGMANVRRLLDDGLTVGLGTDGCSSSNDLDPWVVMRNAALVSNGVSGLASSLGAEQVVEMATQGGADLLGLGDRVGRVSVGCEADLILLDLDQPHLTPIHDIHALLVFAAGRGDVTDVFVDGRHVVEDRTLLTADVDELMARSREWIEQTLGD